MPVSLIEDPANATLVARKGAQAPGRPAGAVFTEFEGPGMGGSGRFVYNDLDQLAFAAYDTTGSGVWATHPDGTLDLVAHTGDTIAVDGVDKTIYNVWLAGHQYLGSGSCFADDGRLAVHLIFTDDSSAIYIARVPEPASAAVAAAAALMTLVCRRHRHRRAPAR